MDTDESRTHSFIVKIWLEETAEEAGRAVWRGRVTHVSSGKRRYLQELGEIPAFIAPYLGQMGVQFGIRWQLEQWIAAIFARGSSLRGGQDK